MVTTPKKLEELMKEVKNNNTRHKYNSSHQNSVRSPIRNVTHHIHTFQFQ